MTKGHKTQMFLQNILSVPKFVQEVLITYIYINMIRYGSDLRHDKLQVYFSLEKKKQLTIRTQLS